MQTTAERWLDSRFYFVVPPHGTIPTYTHSDTLKNQQRESILISRIEKKRPSPPKSFATETTKKIFKFSGRYRRNENNDIHSAEWENRNKSLVSESIPKNQNLHSISNDFRFQNPKPTTCRKNIGSTWRSTTYKKMLHTKHKRTKDVLTCTPLCIPSKLLLNDCRKKIHSNDHSQQKNWDGKLNAKAEKRTQIFEDGAISRTLESHSSHSDEFLQRRRINTSPSRSKIWLWRIFGEKNRNGPGAGGTLETLKLWPSEPVSPGAAGIRSHSVLPFLGWTDEDVSATNVRRRSFVFVGTRPRRRERVSRQTAVAKKVVIASPPIPWKIPPVIEG